MTDTKAILVGKSNGENVIIPSDDRRHGIHIVAGPGTGKSILMGQTIAYSDSFMAVPTIIFDLQNGATIDNYLWRIKGKRRDGNILNETFREEMTNRIRYVNMAGMDNRIIPFPIYQQLADESPYEISQRLVDAIRRINPELEGAPIQGMNPLELVATTAGEILLKNNWQLDQAERVVRSKEFPEEARRETFIVKVRQILGHPVSRAIYTTTPSGIDWHEVFEKGLTVLFDFRNVMNRTQRRFSMVWTLWNLLDYIKLRGTREPVSIIIDEFSALLTSATAEGQRVFDDDLNELINILQRTYNIWLTVAHQQMVTQFSERAQYLLLGMGTQIIGRPETRKDALLLAQELYQVDPMKIKRDRKQWKPEVRENTSEHPFYTAEGYIAHDTSYDIGGRVINSQRMKQESDPIDYSIAEQHHINARQLLELRPFNFYLRKLHGNELTPFSLIGMNITFPWDTDFLTTLRRWLMQRDGKPMYGASYEHDYEAVSEEPKPTESAPYQSYGIIDDDEEEV